MAQIPTKDEVARMRSTVAMLGLEPFMRALATVADERAADDCESGKYHSHSAGVWREIARKMRALVIDLEIG